MNQNYCVVLITLILLVSNTYAQEAPGGVHSPEFWIKTYKDGSNKVRWHDILNNRDSLPPGSSSLNINFHSSYLFPAAGRLVLHNTKQEQKTFIGAFYPRYDNIAIVSPRFYEVSYNGSYISDFSYNQLSVGNIPVNSPFVIPLLQNFEINSKDGLRHSMKIGAHSFSRLSTNESNPWGSEKETEIRFDFDGYLPELLIYDRVLKNTELTRLYSYFAIKYALTLNQPYVNSEGQVVWDNLKNAKFHNSVAGIGKDMKGAILQREATTTYEDFHNNKHSFFYDADGDNRSVTIRFTQNAFERLADQKFLFWGNDTTKLDSVYEIDKVRFPALWVTSRKWMMQNDWLLPDTTEVKIGNPLRSVLNNKIKSFQLYYLIKDDKPLDLPDIIHFTKDSLLNGMVWKEDSTVFSFAVAERLRFQVKKANRTIYRHQRRCGGNEFEELNSLKKPDHFLYKAGFYYYKTGNIFKRCRYRVVYKYSNQVLTFFSTGGVGATLTYQITDKEQKPVSSGNIDRTSNGRYQTELSITIPALASGIYNLSITDETGYTTTMPVKLN